MSAMLAGIAEKLPIYTKPLQGLILIGTDAAQWLNVPASTPNILVSTYEWSIEPSSLVWPVEGLKVDIYSAHESYCIEARLITALLEHGASDIALFQFERGQLQSPLHYSQKALPARAAA